MKLSIIITIYKETIIEVKRAIESIVFDSEFNYEIIIVIDNPLYNKMISYLNKNYSNKHYIKIILNKKNMGAGKSRNIAINQSSGKYIVILDSDDEYINNKLNKQYRYMIDNKNIDILFTGWEEIDTKTLYKEIKLPSKNWFKNPEKYFFIKSMMLHSSIMIKSEIMKKYPYPDIKRGEDFKIFLDMISDNINFDLFEEPLYRYYVTKESDEIYRSKVHDFSREFIKVLTKKIKYFIFNPYFWIMYFRIFSEYVLSYNKFTYKIFYIALKKIMKKIIT